jgi:hypothetical protein
MDAFEQQGGINAHQADAVWSMVRREDIPVSRAVETVVRNAEDYRYGKRGPDELVLPQAIESGEALESETMRFFRNLAMHVRTSLSQVREPVITRLSADRRADLLPEWRQIAASANEIVRALERSDELSSKRVLKAGD